MGAGDLVFMSRQLMSVLSAHTKTVTSQGPVFTQSLEQGTDNPRVENCVLTAISLYFEGSDQMGAFYVGWFWGYGFIPVFFIYIFLYFFKFF